MSISHVSSTAILANCLQLKSLYIERKQKYKDIVSLVLSEDAGMRKKAGVFSGTRRPTKFASAKAEVRVKEPHTFRHLLQQNAVFYLGLVLAGSGEEVPHRQQEALLTAWTNRSRESQYRGVGEDGRLWQRYGLASLKPQEGENKHESTQNMVKVELTPSEMDPNAYLLKVPDRFCFTILSGHIALLKGPDPEASRVSFVLLCQLDEHATTQSNGNLFQVSQPMGSVQLIVNYTPKNKEEAKRSSAAVRHNSRNECKTLEDYRDFIDSMTNDAEVNDVNEPTPSTPEPVDEVSHLVTSTSTPAMNLCESDDEFNVDVPVHRNELEETPNIQDYPSALGGVFSTPGRGYQFPFPESVPPPAKKQRIFPDEKYSHFTDTMDTSSEKHNPDDVNMFDTTNMWGEDFNTGVNERDSSPEEDDFFYLNDDE